MHSRILSIPMAVVFIFLLACQNKEKPPEQTISQKPTLAPDTSASDTAGAGQYFARAEQFYNEDKFDSAIVYYEKAGELYKGKEMWEQYIRCLNETGYQFSLKIAHEQATQYLEQALALGRQHFGEQHPEVARSYHYLGHLARLRSQYDLALDYRQKALAIRLAKLGERHPEVAKSYQGVGVVYFNKGNYNSALVFIEKGLSIQLATLGEQDPAIVDSYCCLALVYSGKGDYDRELSYYQKVLAMAPTTKIPPLTLVEINRNMGMAYMLKGYYDKALELAQKSLAGALEVGGEKSFDATYGYDLIAHVYEAKNDLTQARLYFEKALSINLNLFGERSHEVAYWSKSINCASIWDIMTNALRKKSSKAQPATALKSRYGRIRFSI